MSQESTQAIDSLFADSQSSSWPSPQVDSSEDVVTRIEQTLNLIAEATVVAGSDQPLEQYDLTIVVPVYNERQTLPQVLRRIDEVMPPSTEVIVVNDGSTDGTGEWLRSLPMRRGRKIIHRRNNHGKGSAIRAGIRHSVGRVIAIQDADLEYDASDLLRVVWPILEDKADVVYGSRYLQPGNDRSLFHRFGNWALTKTSNCMTGLQLTDMETCHKAFRGDLLRSLSLQESRFGFEPEVTAKVARQTKRIMEVPTVYQGRSYKDGKKIGWRDGLSAIRCIWKYRHG